MWKQTLPICLLFITLSANSQPTPFTTCPNVNIAVVRAGTNADVGNPLSIYNVTSTGQTSLLAGVTEFNPPAGTAAPLQINGVGVSQVTGFAYGMEAQSNSPFSPRFLRLGANGQAQQIGVLVPPPAGAAELAFVNTASGEMNGLGDYFFTAGTLTQTGPSTYTVTKFFLGKLTNAQLTTASGTAPILPQYTQLDLSDADCSASGLLTSISTFTSTADAMNSGLRDFVYNNENNTLYSFVSFPSGGSWKLQMISLNPATGVADCYPEDPTHPANAQTEVAGTLLNINGDLQVLFTNGDIYQAEKSGGVFTGQISLLSQAANFSGGPIRGDMASCGGAKLLPVTFHWLRASAAGCAAQVRWQISAQQNVKAYKLEMKGLNGQWGTLKLVPALAHAGDNHIYEAGFVNFTDRAELRVVAEDFDGKQSVSPVAILRGDCDAKSDLMVYNTSAVQSSLEFNYTGALPVRTEVVSMSGALVAKKTLQTTGIQTLPVAHLAAGTYMLRVTLQSGETLLSKFVKK